MEELDLMNNGEEEIKISFNELQKGTLYQIVSIEKTTSTYDGKQITGMKARIAQDGMALFTYLPNKLTNLSPALIKLINEAAPDNRFAVAYYGSIGRQNIGRIHKPNEDINENLLQSVSKLNTPKTPTKRPHDHEDESSKRFKQD